MSRYIDAEAVLEKFRKEYQETRRLIKNGNTYLDTLAEGYTECRLIINRAKLDAISKEPYEQIRFERDLNQQLYEALLKDVNDYQGVICNYCLKDQTDECISPDEAVLACGQFKWRGLNHENTEKKRKKYGEIRAKGEGESK